MPVWRIDIVRNEHLGIVTAPNAQEALARAASLFRIEPHRYNELMKTKIEQREPDRFNRITYKRVTSDLYRRMRTG
jgi:hypothetical protein